MHPKIEFYVKVAQSGGISLDVEIINDFIFDETLNPVASDLFG